MNSLTTTENPESAAHTNRSTNLESGGYAVKGLPRGKVGGFNDVPERVEQVGEELDADEVGELAHSLQHGRQQVLELPFLCKNIGEFCADV